MIYNRYTFKWCKITVHHLPTFYEFEDIHTPIDILLFKWNESKVSVFSINDEGE